MFGFPLFFGHIIAIKKKSYKKRQWRPPSKNKKRGENLSPRKACHSIGAALLKSVAEIGTQSAMKSSRKTLHEFTSHIPLLTIPHITIAVICRNVGTYPPAGAVTDGQMTHIRECVPISITTYDTSIKPSVYSVPYLWYTYRSWVRSVDLDEDRINSNEH
jgi:hypothetical protein